MRASSSCSRIGLFALLSFSIATLACSSGDATSGDPSIDAAVDAATDAGGDAASDTRVGDDTSAGDAPIDGGADTRADVAADAVDTGSASDGGCACKADFCGCGTCASSDIVCTKAPPSCPLGCASGCTELATTVCACEGDRCVRKGATGDIGCYTDLDCPGTDCCAHGGAARPGGRGTCAPAGSTCCVSACP